MTTTKAAAPPDPERAAPQSGQPDDPEIHRRVGQLLGDAREAAGLPQSHAARLMGVAQSRIAKLELGRRRLLFIEAVQLAKLYGVPVSRFDPGAVATSARGGRRPRVDRRS